MEADQGDDYTHLMVSQLPLHEMGGLDNFHLSADQGLLKQKKIKMTGTAIYTSIYCLTLLDGKNWALVIYNICCGNFDIYSCTVSYYPML